MAEKEPKMKFDHDYWLNELVTIGKQLMPEKFTDEYIVVLKKKWKTVGGLTRLHLQVVKRRNDLFNHQNNKQHESANS